MKPRSQEHDEKNKTHRVSSAQEGQVEPRFYTGISLTHSTRECNILHTATSRPCW